MFFKKDNDSSKAELDALSKSQAIIHFSMDGLILDANENFLKLMNYSLNEIKGKHHSIFADKKYANSDEYKSFWQELNKGIFTVQEFKRFTNDGKEIWIQGSYNPILDKNSKPYKVVKYATDITNKKMLSADLAGRITAIGRSQAVIEFALDGTILDANENFLKTLGYELSEIKGKHHSMFVEKEEVSSPAYKEFWNKLNNGIFMVDEYLRIGKGGKEVWIRASYNPIFDQNGKVVKVVKFAIDVTEDKMINADFQCKVEAIENSQAVIEFNIDGTIVKANKIFLDVMGYDLEEIKGKHHSMFVGNEYSNSAEYKDFWNKLAHGERFSGEFKRFGKNNKLVYVSGSYNPVSDMKGNLCRVIKYATDITAETIAKEKSRDISSNIQAVAAATEEMTAAVGEISKNMMESSQSVDDIAEKIKKSTEMMMQIQETSKAMESVVELIRGIAGQVNLLALNATIEAARAGDSGKGFAVVAGEVKKLANDVGHATDAIEEKISYLQKISSIAAENSQFIDDASSNVQSRVNSVATAIEEQNSMTREIAMNMQKISDFSLPHN